MELGKLRVRDVMTAKVRTVGPDDRLEDVHRLMQLAGFRHAPVVDQGKLVGVISDHDIYLAWSSGRDTPVGAVMTKSPRWIGADAMARDAAALLLRHKIGCLPVLDGDKVVGIVTESDFVAMAHRALLIQEALTPGPS